MSIKKNNFSKINNLDQISYICYLILFQKHIKNMKILILIDSKSEVNAINPVNIAKLGLKIPKININT